MNLEVIETTSMKSLTVTFAFRGILKSYVTLVDSNQLDFGFCYIETSKKYAAVRQLRFQNISNEELYISAVSNLSQQCLIFR
jgi:hypothetical protein